MQRAAPAGTPNAEPERIPLVVDIDALLSVDALTESLTALLRNRPRALLQLPGWLARGTAGIAQGLARTAAADAPSVPFRASVLAYLREQRAAARPLALCTRRDDGAAQFVIRELGPFDAVWVRAGFGRYRSEQRRELLLQRFGVGIFEYLAHRGDRRLLRDAHAVVLVAPSRRLARRVAGTSPMPRVLDPPAGRLADYLHAMRPLHWIKNLLLFVPIDAAHYTPDARGLRDLAMALIAFSMCASSGYLVNDLFDLSVDRANPQTRQRRLAKGVIRPSRALLAAALLLLVGFAVGSALPPRFLAVLGSYYVLMTMYSIQLKNIAVLDVFILAFGYALRVAAGAYVAGVELSVWLIALCMFLFLSLALAKRYAELIAIRSIAGPDARVRGYRAADASLIAVQGIASGYIAVLVLALYTNAAVAQRLYARHELFWVVCLLLLYWINYLWLMARRGRVPHDPVIFALKDRTSLILAVAMGAAALCAL